MQTKTKVDANGRVCTQCHVYKLWVEFDFNSLGPNGHNSACRICRRLRSSQRDYLLQKKYDLLPGQYDELLKLQSGVCKLCSRKSDRQLIVDHCHKTGRIRGLLCYPCNLALGHIEKHRDQMLKIYMYLDGEL